MAASIRFFYALPKQARKEGQSDVHMYKHLFLSKLKKNKHLLIAKLFSSQEVDVEAGEHVAMPIIVHPAKSI